MFKITFGSIPSIVYAHSFSINKYEFHNRQYNFLEIAFITEGELVLNLDGVEYLAKQGDCLMIPPNTLAHCKVSENCKRHSHLSVGVRGIINVEIVEHLTNPLDSHNHLIFYSEIYQHLKEEHKFEKLFTNLIMEFNHNHYVAAVGLFLQLCGTIHESTFSSDQKTMSAVYTRKIIDYIENHFTRKISISELAKYLSITTGYASQVFKNTTNETIVHYINKTKINKAKEYMERGGISVEYAASMVGVDNPAYFSRLFKKHTGISPSEFKHSIQRKFIPYS